MSDSKSHKYKIIVSYLRELIDSARKSKEKKIPSENELAMKFGVSRQTARQGISHLVNEGSLYRVRGSGTFIVTRKKRIGVLMSYTDSYIFTDILRGIDRELSERDMTMILMSSGNNIRREKECLETFINQGIDGFIYEPARSGDNRENISLVKNIISSGTKTVFINGYLEGICAGKILTDDFLGMKILVEKLYRAGHRNIAGIFSSDLVQGKRRYKGFCDAMKENNINVLENGVYWYEASGPEQSIRDNMEKTALDIFRNGFTAVCCYNDILAQMISEIFLRHGILIPDHISITGFDGSEISRLYSVSGGKETGGIFGNIATVSHPAEKLGKKAVEKLTDLMEGKISEKEINIQMEPEFSHGRSIGTVNEQRSIT